MKLVSRDTGRGWRWGMQQRELPSSFQLVPERACLRTREVCWCLGGRRVEAKAQHGAHDVERMDGAGAATDGRGGMAPILPRPIELQRSLGNRVQSHLPRSSIAAAHLCRQLVCLTSHLLQLPDLPPSHLIPSCPSISSTQSPSPIPLPFHKRRTS